VGDNWNKAAVYFARLKKRKPRYPPEAIPEANMIDGQPVSFRTPRPASAGQREKMTITDIAGGSI
jgi:predicted SnoaL-like aldol condensation-catalyzing enzyme